MSTQAGESKRWVFWVIIAIGMLLIINLSRGALGLLGTRDRVKEAEEKVAKLEAEKRQLEEQVGYQLSEGYAEKEIREKLNMSKPGEKVVILTEQGSAETTNPDGEAVGEKPEGYRSEIEDPPRPNWKLWAEALGLM